MKTCKALLIVLAVCALAVSACQPERGVAGRYEAPRPGGEPGTVVLELKEGGKGSWTLDDGFVEFRWEVRNGRIVIHTPTGGAVAGELIDSGSPEGSPRIHITIPGAGDFEFVAVARP
jgi:hypothetical protein